MEREGHPQIDLDRIDELLRFLPAFEAEDRSFVAGWTGGESNDSGATTIRHPVYEDDVLEFFEAAGREWWTDFDYARHDVHAMIGDDDFIRSCSMDDFKTMLTFCVRGERFCDGLWQRLLESGRIAKLLRRLQELRQSVAD
jgi:hypothetical protein